VQADIYNISVLKYDSSGQICVYAMVGPYSELYTVLVYGFDLIWGPIYDLCGLIGNIYYIKAKKTRLIYDIYHKKFKKCLKFFEKQYVFIEIQTCTNVLL
jgi:hypothetical protein